MLCAERSCDEPADQSHGHREDCLEPFIYGRRCQFECDAGYEMAEGGVSEVICDVTILTDRTSSVQWDGTPSACTGGSTCIIAYIILLFLLLDFRIHIIIIILIILDAFM